MLVLLTTSPQLIVNTSIINRSINTGGRERRSGNKKTVPTTTERITTRTMKKFMSIKKGCNKEKEKEKENYSKSTKKALKALEESRADSHRSSNGSSSRRTNSTTSIVEDEGRDDSGKRKSSFVKKLRQTKLTRGRDNQDERINELREQNQYLAEKVQFLRLQKMRNESEVIRMDIKQKELQKTHDAYVMQMSNFEEVVGDWRGFHQDLSGVSGVWGKASQRAADADREIDFPEFV
jgi:hypothetical protein